jgi:cytidylate kinase
VNLLGSGLIDAIAVSVPPRCTVHVYVTAAAEAQAEREVSDITLKGEEARVV